MFLLSYISKPTIIPGVVKPVWQGVPAKLTGVPGPAFIVLP